MKRVLLLSLIVIVLGLAGCDDTTAPTNTTNGSTTTTETENYSVLPVRIDFEILDGNLDQIETDMYYWTWFCDVENPDMICTENHYGSGFQFVEYTYHSQQTIVMDGTKIADTAHIEFTVYYSDNAAYKALYPNVTLYDSDTNTFYYDKQIGIGFNNADHITTTLYFPTSEDSVFVLEYTINFVKMDTLLSSDLQEYDADGILLQTTNITLENADDPIALNQNTSYVVLNETFLDIESQSYQVQTTYEAFEFNQIFVKFLEEFGFAQVRQLHLTQTPTS
ncbi:MAG: hypothetical protein JXB08_00305 [Bacilli bacterium]|nr:hypothetical protein [Bacilli bacterium]MBN2876817.1 hypothetical protein [Bacilli bacterium]